ncbi:MAG: M1 family metallopeptidase [Anaerolineae bacterium]|nr:M1 family metallopeptidase [Anaerolineae bacterium]
MRRFIGALSALIILLAAFPAPSRASGVPSLPDEALLTDPIWARAGFEGLALLFLNRTRYLLALDVDHRRGVLTGKARVLYVNNSDVPHSEVIFRLYPNHPVHQGRRMRVSAVSVNGMPTSGQIRDANGTVFAVPLAIPIPPNGTATFEFDYTITVPAGSNFFYVSEPFPMVAVYDHTGWRQDVATKGLDYAYTESALYAVRIRAPSNYGTWFVGTLKSAEHHSDGTSIYTVVTGPVRNFVLVQVRGWRVIAAQGAGVPINVLYNGDPVGAQEIAQISVASFNYFDRVISSYPYAELSVIATRFPSGGEEYPTLIFVNNDRTSIYRRFVTAHEVAHQWFYGIAGNDTLRNAWLDESLAQIAGYLFYKHTGYGGVNAAEEYWSHILTWYNRITTVRPINTSLEDFRDFSDYMSTVYGGGAVFMRQLGEQIGDGALIAGLSAYVREVNLGVGTPMQFFNAIQAQTAQNLRPLFCLRVGIMC